MLFKRDCRYRLCTGISVSDIHVIGILFLMLFTAIPTGAQDLNPPYPRFGIFTFSGGEDACIDMFKYFDVIAISPDLNMGQKYRTAYPDAILLGTSGSLIAYGMGEQPEAWYYHDINGERITLWTGTYLMNNTIICPLVDLGDGYGPKRYIDQAALNVEQEIDFNVYDGVFHDWWWGGVGYDAKVRGDLNQNGVVDRDEWGIDSLRTVWEEGIKTFHALEYDIPNLKYVDIQIGSDWNIWPHVNGACFEDWPIYNGPWERWRKIYNDDATNTKDPKIMIFDSAISHFNNAFPTVPYKNNYHSVRFGLSSCLLTSSFFYVDEGGQIGHHGNVHIYDEFEAKGALGYPRTDMVKLEGKPLASTTYASGVWLRFFDHGVSIVNATGMTQTITASEIASLDPVGGSQYYRFQGGQDPDFNDGTPVTDVNPLELWGDIHSANWADNEVYGDGTMLFRTRKLFITPIVIDNNENNQTSPGSEPVSYQGGWVLSSDGADYYALYTGRDYGPYQPDAFAWSPEGNGGNVAVYTPTIGLAGYYEIFEWHGYRGSSPSSYQLSSQVPATIYYGNNRDTTVTINQTNNFGQWNSLGLFYFDKGTAGRVEISNNTSGIVISDAIEFVFNSSPEGFDTTPPAPPEGVEVFEN